MFDFDVVTGPSGPAKRHTAVPKPPIVSTNNPADAALAEPARTNREASDAAENGRPHMPS